MGAHIGVVDLTFASEIAASVKVLPWFGQSPSQPSPPFAPPLSSLQMSDEKEQRII